MADCNEALRLRPSDASTLDSRGFAHLKAGQLDAAIVDYEAALKADPKLYTSLYGRGVARSRKGDKPGGESDIASAKALRSNVADDFAKWGVKAL